MEDEDLCNNDYVEVRSGGVGGTLLGRHCGTSLPTNVTVGSNLWVKFHSNQDTPGLGFRAQYNSSTFNAFYCLTSALDVLSSRFPTFRSADHPSY